MEVTCIHSFKVKSSISHFCNGCTKKTNHQYEVFQVQMNVLPYYESLNINLNPSILPVQIQLNIKNPKIRFTYFNLSRHFSYKKEGRYEI